LWALSGLSAPFLSRAFGGTGPGGGGAAGRPRIALIIDDIGFSRARARAFLDMEVPITYAILPRLRLTRELAGEIHQEGREIMLHQPMEPFDGRIDPGPGAVFVKDPPEKITSVLEENMGELAHAAGMNNHMGSRFTSCPEKMAQALPVVRDHGLFFVDSLTSGRSKGYPAACRLHMPAACRNIFIDHQPGERVVRRSLEELLRHARRCGKAIGIGHPRPETAAALRWFLSSIPTGCADFVHMSELL
jgi:uncharacterized protein